MTWGGWIFSQIYPSMQAGYKRGCLSCLEDFPLFFILLPEKTMIPEGIHNQKMQYDGKHMLGYVYIRIYI